MTELKKKENKPETDTQHGKFQHGEFQSSQVRSKRNKFLEWVMSGIGFYLLTTCLSFPHEQSCCNDAQCSQKCGKGNEDVPPIGGLGVPCLCGKEGKRFTV